MDSARAKRIASELSGKRVGEWTVQSLIAHGKSALVLRAERGGQVAALKVFDPEIVERYGKPEQLERIRRELLLRANPHPNLAVILDGGECSVSDYLFVAMELVNGSTLESVISSIPRAAIRPMIAQVADAARHLETLGLAHRDIKPANIMCSDDFSFARLMDLGVIKQVATSGITDEDGERFIGTHQYSPPEFLAREEQDDLNGWRAITFYQLGAVLHDLITRRELFADDARLHGRLVTAIKEKVPQIFENDVDPDLILLAQNCLQKSPPNRLSLVRWDSFSRAAGGVAKQSVDVDLVRARIQQRRAARVASRADSDDGKQELDACRDIRERVQELARSEATDNGALPPALVTSSAASVNRCTIRVDCPPSPNDALDLPLTFLLEVLVVDGDTNAVTMEGFASIAGNPHASCSPVELFRGTLADDVVRKALCRFFLLGLDLAQAKSAGASRDTIAEWLPLNAAWEDPIG